MLGQFFTDHIIWAVVLFALVYAGDYYFTILGVKGQKKYVSEHIAVEGSLELTPGYQKDVDNQRMFSWRFVGFLLGFSWLIFFSWLLFVVRSNQPAIFQAVYGAFLFSEISVHHRHLNNMAQLYFTRRGAGLEGKVSYARWLVYKNSASHFFADGLIFLLVFLFSGSWFFLGGAFMCMVYASSHMRMSNQFLKPTASAPTADTRPSSESVR